MNYRIDLRSRVLEGRVTEFHSVVTRSEAVKAVSSREAVQEVGKRTS